MNSIAHLKYGSVTGPMPTEKEIKQGRRDPKKTAFCQVIDYKVVAEFDEDQMAFGIRRPRNEIRTIKSNETCSTQVGVEFKIYLP